LKAKLSRSTRSIIKNASAKISADVVETAKGKKVLVFHQKLRKNHRKLRGHRQHYTSVKINKITLN
jgi:large subunit ribosomal protein L21